MTISPKDPKLKRSVEQALFHPYALLFPRMDRERYADFVNDLAENGLTTPIIKFEEKILDGIHREIGCRDAGIKPRYTYFKGSKDEALAYVLSQNIHRRHMTKGQIMVILEENSHVQTLRRKRRGGGDGKPVAQVPAGAGVVETSPEPGLSLDELAKLAGSNRSEAALAKQLVRDAAPEILDEVKAGTLTYHRAKDIVEQTRVKPRSGAGHQARETADRKSKKRQQELLDAVRSEMDEGERLTPAKIREKAQDFRRTQASRAQNRVSKTPEIHKNHIIQKDGFRLLRGIDQRMPEHLPVSSTRLMIVDIGDREWPSNHINRAFEHTMRNAKNSKDGSTALVFSPGHRLERHIMGMRTLLGGSFIGTIAIEREGLNPGPRGPVYSEVVFATWWIFGSSKDQPKYQPASNSLSFDDDYQMAHSILSNMSAGKDWVVSLYAENGPWMQAAQDLGRRFVGVAADIAGFDQLKAVVGGE